MIHKHLSEYSSDELVAAIKYYNHQYFVKNDPQISDMEFDQLVEALRRLDPTADVLYAITSDQLPESKKVRHSLPMLSLDKCYDEIGIIAWTQKFDGDVVASPKVDGCAISLVYDSNGYLMQSSTRGDGVTGEDITRNVRFIDSIPQQVNMPNSEVRGEIYMSLSVFNRYEKEFSNPRNLAAGAIKQKNPQKTGAYGLGFFAYDIIGATDLHNEKDKLECLSHLGFATVDWQLVERDNLQTAFENILEKSHTYDYATDGVVFRANNVLEQRRLGETAHHPRYAIAYKFQGESGISTLEDVHWSVSRTGAITPVAIVSPVVLSGARVQRASLHNISIMQKLNLSLGAKVIITRRGGVIPNIESVVTPGPTAIVLPCACPSCAGPVIQKDDFLFCANPNNCHHSKVGELSHFVSVIGIDGLGEKWLEKLVESELVTDPSMLYSLSVQDLLAFDRMGDVLAQKIIDNIQAHRQLPVATFLQALGINELGDVAAKTIAKALGSLDIIMAASHEELTHIHGIGPVMADYIRLGFEHKKLLIEKLLMHITVIDSAPDISHDSTWPYAGKSFVFTATLSELSRKQAKEKVLALGGRCQTQLTQKTDVLVIGAEGKAGSKLTKANKYNDVGNAIEIMSEDAFCELIDIASNRG